MINFNQFRLSLNHDVKSAIIELRQFLHAFISEQKAEVCQVVYPKLKSCQNIKLLINIWIPSHALKMYDVWESLRASERSRKETDGQIIRSHLTGLCHLSKIGRGWNFSGKIGILSSL